MAENSFARLGYNNAGTFTPVDVRAQDVFDTNGVSAQTHMNDENIHVSSQQVDLISGAAQKTNLTAVLTDAVISADGTSVNVTFSVYNADANTTTELIRTIPLASESAAGAMPQESYSALQQAIADISSLKQKGGVYLGQSFATKAALDAYEIPERVNFGDYTYVLDDETQDGSTTQYVCTNTGTEGEPVKAFVFAIVVEHDPIAIATIATAGIVKSVEAITANGGKVFVELDGTMSVIGWDDLKNSVVRVTGAQSIAGVKTFTDEPILPSKTTDAVDDGTKPATEAQVYKVAQAVPTIPEGSTSQKGIVQLEDSVTSTATDKAATPNSVKTANDEAVKLDAAYCEDESDMASKNLRNGALVIMAVENSTVDTPQA